MKMYQKGFSLVELMVVIAIIASIAFPLYTTFVTKAKLTDVISLAAKDEKNNAIYLSTNGNSYGTEAEFNQSSLKSEVESNVGSNCIIRKQVNYVDSDNINIITDIDTNLC